MPDVNINAFDAKHLAYLKVENAWTSGGEGRQGRNHQLIPLDRWVNDQLLAEKQRDDTWIEREIWGDRYTGICLVMSGRGWGKTKTGAQWLFRQACLYPGVICHAIAPTYSDLRGVMFEGPSGLVSVIPRECIDSLTYSPYPEVTLWNGSKIRGFSSETPNRLRGPQATFVWGDELASWYSPDECIANIDFSTRIAFRTKDGKLIQPQRLYTTTPRPVQFLDQMIKRGVRLVRGSTYENRANLADDFFVDVEKYEGTVIGRQELHGELLDISESAIIKKSWLRMWPASEPLPFFEFIMVSLDTAFTEKTFDDKKMVQDPTACTVWGVFKHNKRWNLLLVDCWQEWLGFPALIARAKKEMQQTYGAREEPMFRPMIGPAFMQIQAKKPDLLIIEDKGSGISLRQTLSDQGQDSYPYNPGNADKTARLHIVSHLPHAGRIWIPEGWKRDKQSGKRVPTGAFATWTNDMLDQVCVYSGPKTTPHDDWVDSTSQAWRVFADKFAADDVTKPLPDAAKQGQPNPEQPVRPGEAPPGEDDERHDRIQRIETMVDGEYIGDARGAYDG